ncbi:PTS transporter subunit EIIC [Mycoplasma sp. OR1901]|nr:PTS transporter subunit EIIC [Mycoplasma sp. OR1901]QKT05227.1 PTS transporter subunit EIIC [Mycoplasma sp. OR1901]
MMSMSKNNQQTSFWTKVMSKLSSIGATLMFPIAVLPVAAVLLRIGAEIPTDTAFSKLIQEIIIKPGAAVFDNLPILFGVGLAFGFTKDKRAEAAFAGLIATYIVIALVPSFTTGFYGKINFSEGQGFAALFGGKYNAVLGGNVLNGLAIGALVAYVYNNTNSVKLPKVLGFFSGKRLAPALAIISGLVFSFVWAIIFPWIAYVIYVISKAMSDAVSFKEGTSFESVRWTRAGIMGVYGFINRLFIPFGLHHIPNNLFWFQLGSWAKEGGAAGETVNGDIFIFLQGVAKGNPGGIFQAGFFPMMMFGLPALVLAFIKTAQTKEQKTKVIALFGSAAVVSFLTGITEPIEFAFLYVSPLLYFIHAILTGVFAFITGAFGIQLGFGFSAGFMDFVLSIPKSLRIINESGYTGAAKVMANPFWIIPLGLLTGAAYYFTGYFMITKLNLSTPGRGAGVIADSEEEAVEASTEGELSAKAKKIVSAFGGWDNIVEYNNCATRLRYTVKDASKVNEEELKKSGIFGLSKVSDTGYHAIVGVEAESLNNEIVSNKGAKLQ